MQYALTGNDALIINDRVIRDYTDGSTITISYPNDRIGLTTGKNDNTVISDNRQGGNATLELRVLRGSGDDKFFNGLSVLQGRDLPSFPTMNGAFDKRIGDGFGNITHDNFILLGGVFQRYPDVQENLNGDTEQGTSVYTLIFSKVNRGLV